MHGLTLALALSAAATAQNSPGNQSDEKSMKTAPSVDSHDGMVFEVADPMNRNTVTFKSTAPLEDIVGTSNKVTGRLVFDPAKPEKGGHGLVSVPVNSLGTGIPLRDEHLAGANWLNAAKNPNISFKVAEVKDLKPVKSTEDAKTFDVVAVGDFSMNGRTKHMSVPARITYLKESEATRKRQPGDLLAVRAAFDIVLADFGVTGPEGMNVIGSKVGEKVEVELSLVAFSTQGSVADNSGSDK
jgi:polyisoprenoid-binding protein YceI